MSLAIGAFAVPLKGLAKQRRLKGQLKLPRRGEGVMESKLELSSEFDAEDPELRVEAANQVGAMNVTSTLWPPQRQQADPTELSPVQQETTVGRFTGSAPAFGAWPFYEADYAEFPAELQPLSEKDKELEIYKAPRPQLKRCVKHETCWLLVAGTFLPRSWTSCPRAP